MEIDVGDPKPLNKGISVHPCMCLRDAADGVALLHEDIDEMKLFTMLF